MYALYLADDGRILHVTNEKFVTNVEAYDPNGDPITIDLVDGYVIVDALPEGDVTDYRYVDGEYVYDPLPQEEPQAEPTTDDVLNALLGVLLLYD